MKKNYILIISNLLSFGKINLELYRTQCTVSPICYRDWSRQIFMGLLIFCIVTLGYGQKNGNNKDVILHSCVENIGNGLYRAYFGYTNPTNKTITVGAADSFVFLSDKIDESQYEGLQKFNGINIFEPGTHNKVFPVVFASNGHAKWTVVFNRTNETKIRATSSSPLCAADGFIVPVIGPGNGKTEGFVSPELISLGAGTAGNTPSDIIYQINPNQKVLVQLVPFNGQTQAVIDVLVNVFGLVYDSNAQNSDFIVDPSIIISKGLAAIDVFFPINKILSPPPPNPPMPALIDYFNIIKSAQTLYTPFTSGKIEKTGKAVTQGDSTQTTNTARESFRIVTPEGSLPVDGRGSKIGIISNSFDADGTNQAIDVGNGDLPGTAGNGNPNGYNIPVQVIKEYPYLFGKISDEGRAMAQIAHDIAPGASLAFSTGVLSPRDFELAIQNLAAADVDVMADDVTFPGEPMFGLSNIGRAIIDFTNSGEKSYLTSSGNFYNNAYQAKFRKATNTIIPNFIRDVNAVAHDFDPGTAVDIYQRFSVKNGETYMIVLQWAEAFASQNNALGSIHDLDFWVVDDQQRLLVGNNYYNNSKDAIEYSTFKATADGQANFLITSATGDPGALPFRYIIFAANGMKVLEFFNGAPTISGHALTPEAYAIGAVDFRKAANPVPQPFSSYAGTLSDDSQPKIELASYDGGNTNVLTIGQNEVAGVPVDGDIYKNFFGTSASVVHAAAAFALMKSAIPPWYGPDNTLDVLQLFKETATPAGNVDQVGTGVIDAVEAFKRIATQTAVITDFTTEEGEIASAEEFELTINGKYFPEDPKVLYGDEELVITSKSATEIKAIVGPFTGNEPLTVFTNSTVPLGTDGGKSNPIYLLDAGKLAINIMANDIAIEYGQAYEEFFDITVEGLPEGVTFESLGLPDLIFTTAAVAPYPKVFNYVIFPSFDLDNATLEQLAALEGFQVNFKNGALAVTKNDLTITPDPVVTTYGMAISLKLNYSIPDPTGIADYNDFIGVISTAHAGDFYPENTLALINRFNALVNTEGFAELQGGSWMATENTLLNRFNALVNEMDLINLDVEDLDNYLINRFNALVNTQLNRFNALVNGEGLLNGLVFFNNRFNALVNDSGLGGPEDANDYASVFAVLHADDDAEDDPTAPGIAKFYSLNMITGLGATSGTEIHYAFPGAFLAPIAANFNISYLSGTITVGRATLTVETNDLLINQGEIPSASAITSLITGYAYDENTESVFPNGIPYSFVNAQGHEYQVGDVGVFFITIAETQNYIFEYAKIGKLYVTPADSGLRKIRTYLDCVEFNPNGPAGFQYTANFRYENPNSKTLYVLQGPDNNLSGAGAGQIIGELPVVFLPGQGKFKIQFNGSQLKWSLTTLDSAHKTSTSSDASSSSNRCSSNSAVNELENPSYVLWPNPVQGILTIQKNITGSGDLDVFDLYGILYYHNTFGNEIQTLTVDMSTYPAGIYFVRFTTNKDVKVYSVLKD